jgi:C4-dicarboxylate-specific signal transduction histidine kinase
MSASIAHEINQPLAAVVTNGDACIRWLDAVPPDIERARQTAVRIVRDGHSAAAVVQHIRSLFKNSAPAKLPLDLSGVLDEVMQLMHNKLRDKFIAVNVDLEDGLPQVFADRVQIQQVLINLLQNAIDAMEAINEGSKVVLIKARIQDPNNMVVHVCDRGVGIANADRIFEPFFTTKQKGLGVGLSISRSIIQSHGGRMWATPGEAGGSVVAFTLPIHSQASDDAGEGVIPPLQRQRD